MKCPHCKKEIPDQAKFCGFCGNKISEENTFGKENADKNGNKHKKKKKKRKWLKTFFGVILSVLLIGVVLFAIAVKRQMDSNEKEKEKERQEAYYKTFKQEEIRYENGMSYVDSRLLLTTEEGISYSETEKTIQSMDGEIIGYIPLTGDYQVQFRDKSYEDLEKLIAELKETDGIFEVTLEKVFRVNSDSIDYTTDPWISAAYAEDPSGRIWSSRVPDGANWWAEAIMMPDVWKMEQEFSQVKVGLVDSYFDRTNEDLADAFAQDGIVGQDDIDVSQLYETAVETERQNQATEPKQSSADLAHGSVDAGIIGARNNGFGICGISQNANLYGVSLFGNSDHWNVSLMSMKYGIAALLEREVKVISISMGWDDLLFAAQQEDTKEDDRTDVAIKELNQCRDAMEVFLKRCLKKYDFLLVKSAGNNSGYEYVKVDVEEEHPYGYRKAEEGDSKSVRIQKQCDGKYDIFGSITDEEVKEHILVVGSADLTKYKQKKSDENTDTIGSAPEETATDTTIVGSSSRVSQWYKYTISKFSNTGERVNLYAPGGAIREKDQDTNIWILSDYPTNITEYMRGTSQATPMVAGTAYLIWGVHPEFTAKQVRQILLSSTQKLKDGEMEFRFLNAYAAVRKAQDTKPEETGKKEERALLLGYAYTTIPNEEEEESIEQVEAEVTVTGKSDGKEQKVELDGDGTFSIFLAAGDYTIKAKADGYEEVSQDVKISEGQTNFIAILLQEEETYEPKWVVKPAIEADDIYYIQNLNLDKSWNEQNMQLMGNYAVIEKDGSLGLIDMDGKLKGQMDYGAIHSFGYDEKVLLDRIEPVYTEKYKTDWSLFMLEGDTISPIDGLGGGDFTYAYYAEKEEIKVFDEMAAIYHEYVNRTSPPCAIPVSQAYVAEGDVSASAFLASPYAVCLDNKLVTNFIYDECGPESSSLLAVKKDGKWGYINNKGEIVIPFEYEESWNYEQTGEYSTYQMHYCYGATEGFVPLCKNGTWEMRDTNGNIVIPSGYFEAIRPVYNGKCWVKKDGKWGVIALKGDEKSSNAAEISDSTNETLPEDAVEFDGHYYYVYNLDSIDTWEAAKQYCEEQGGYLATITSAEENEFLYQYLREFSYESAYFGLTDSKEEGVWIWDNGENVSYTNWHEDEPNSENPNEDYAMFYFKYQDGTWNDGDFGGQTVNSGRVFVCEWGES